MTLRLAASAEMLFLDLPFNERVARIHDLGFLVEIWSWDTKDLKGLAGTGATINSMTGYIEGDLLEDDGIERLLETAKLSIEVSNIIGCRNLNLHGTGLDGKGLPIRAMDSTTLENWKKAKQTLTRIAELGEAANKVFTLENLNLAVDHPRTPFARAEETISLVRAVNSPHLKLNLDLYHAQIGEGNLTQLIDSCLELIGEIQVADVPGRMEPGTGEINYPHIARHLNKIGYKGVVGLEGWASGDSEVALSEFRKTFTDL